MAQARLRDLGITIGQLPVGQFNAITDVSGVRVGHATLIYDEPRVARTGVTIIQPREERVFRNNCFAGFHSFNGSGEMTGLHWVAESGLLTSPIGLTNTHQVGIVRDALVASALEYEPGEYWRLPVVAETYDGYLNDINAFHLIDTHVLTARTSAKSGRVEEGNVGGGTGMICHGFKGGIGTSSRLVETPNGTYTVGVLVQANYGRRDLLRVNGVPVGQQLDGDHTPLPDGVSGSSIIGVIATDAPLIPGQCRRLAQRATVGLARVGGVGHNGSGDIFIAFATGNDLPTGEETIRNLKMVPQRNLDPFFDAVAEATEEAILNALTAAETMTGFKDRTVYELPLDDLQRLVG